MNENQILVSSICLSGYRKAGVEELSKLEVPGVSSQRRWCHCEVWQYMRGKPGRRVLDEQWWEHIKQHGNHRDDVRTCHRRGWMTLNEIVKKYGSAFGMLTNISPHVCTFFSVNISQVCWPQAGDLTNASSTCWTQRSTSLLLARLPVPVQIDTDSPRQLLFKSLICNLKAQDGLYKVKMFSIQEEICSRNKTPSGICSEIQIFDLQYRTLHLCTLVAATI